MTRAIADNSAIFDAAIAVWHAAMPIEHLDDRLTEAALTAAHAAADAVLAADPKTTEDLRAFVTAFAWRASGDVATRIEELRAPAMALISHFSSIDPPKAA